MRHAANDGFMYGNGQIRNDILIPRYYDPRIKTELLPLSKKYDLRSIDGHIDAEHIQHNHGSYIPKIYYGTGPIPYVRTSDIANWEIKASPKHGIPIEVYASYKEKQDVQPDDIIFVHEGTYLIGSAAMVTEYDGPMLYQHHLAKFRVLSGSPFDPYFFLAALGSPPVQRQIRSKQFTADTIDSVVGRIGEVVIPVPKDKDRLNEIQNDAKSFILGRAIRKEQLSHALRNIDEWLRKKNNESLDTIFGWIPSAVYSGKTAFLGYRSSHVSFLFSTKDIANDVIIPKYYDPTSTLR